MSQKKTKSNRSVSPQSAASPLTDTMQCDLKHPSCSNCESAAAPCLIYHSRNQAEVSEGEFWFQHQLAHLTGLKVPRNYVSQLEAELQKLTRENRELKIQAQSASTTCEAATPPEHHSPGSTDAGSNPTASPATSDASLNHVQDLVRSVRNVVVEPSRQPQFLGQGGGIALARLVISAIHGDALPSALSTGPCLYDPHPSATVAEASLPPRHAADHLVDVYFQYRTPHLPIVERSHVKEAIDRAYQAMSGPEILDEAAERDIFTAYMIFAIALCDISASPGNKPTQSEGCFRSAVGWLQTVMTGLKSDIETLRSILLLAQFIALCPSKGSLWHLTGTALRLCIDIGLHWESEDQAVHMDPALLYDRRRLWYSTYQLDRLLCITLGRPFGIIDESTLVPLPNPWAMYRRASGSETAKFDLHSQQAHNHLFKLSKLESEIKHVQHSQVWVPKIAYPRANYAAWVQDIQPRLDEWYATVPQPGNAHPSSIFACQAYWDYVYNNAILLLYRPNSTVSQKVPEATVFSFTASCQLIQSIKTLQREGKVDVLWKSTHHLFMAGLGVIYSLWHSKEVRDQNPIAASISTLQSCASTLSAMAESFPGAAGCRNVFDTLSTATVSWLVNENAAELRHSRQEFEKQVGDLLQQLQPSRGAHDNNGTDVPDIDPGNDFAFSEMLSSAAEWPGLHTGEMSGMGSESVPGVATHTFM